jgi:hypothetical protein
MKKLSEEELKSHPCTRDVLLAESLVDTFRMEIAKVEFKREGNLPEMQRIVLVNPKLLVAMDVLHF